MTDELEFPSPQEMTGWLQQEIKSTMRAGELRIKEATDLVTAYASGQLTSEQAGERFHQFSKRWGDALPGIASSENLTDAEIIKAIDETRAKQLARQTKGSTRNL